MGEIKGKALIPAHELALSTSLSADVPILKLSYEEAISYLKRAPLELALKEIDLINGWCIAQYEGVNLGWVKKVGNRYNSHLPKSWRIRADW